MATKMQKDLKTGMVLGLILIAAVACWLSTRPSLSVKARMSQSHKQVFVEQNNLPDVVSYSDVPQLNDNLNTIPAEICLEQNEKIETQKFHIIRDGETLSSIAKKHYGLAHKWQKILDANRNVLKDADTLESGVKLIIPD